MPSVPRRKFWRPEGKGRVRPPGLLSPGRSDPRKRGSNERLGPGTQPADPGAGPGVMHRRHAAVPTPAGTQRCLGLLGAPLLPDQKTRPRVCGPAGRRVREGFPPTPGASRSPGCSGELGRRLSVLRHGHPAVHHATPHPWSACGPGEPSTNADGPSRQPRTPCFPRARPCILRPVSWLQPRVTSEGAAPVRPALE